MAKVGLGPAFYPRISPATIRTPRICCPIRRAMSTRRATSCWPMAITAGADGKLSREGKPLHLEVLSTSLLSSGPEYIAEQFNKMGADAVVVPSDNTNLSNDGKFDINFYPGANVLPSTGFALGVVSGPNPPVGGNTARIHDPVNEDLLLKAKADGTCQGWYAWQDHLLTEYHILPLNTLKYSWFGRNTAASVHHERLRRRQHLPLGALNAMSKNQACFSRSSAALRASGTRRDVRVPRARESDDPADPRTSSG